MGFGGLYTSVSGMRAAQRSLNTITHNISNTNTPHYVRQSVIHADSRYDNIKGNMQKGTGVRINEMRQIRDEFLDIQLRRQLPEFGYFSSKAETLEDVEAVFNEITDSGLQEVFNQFWDTWDEVSKDPSELTLRSLLHESTVALTDTTHHISNQLIAVQRNLDKQLNIKVDRANQLIDEIAEINSLIAVQEMEGHHISSNDLRDERNVRLDELHSLVPIKTYNDSRKGVVVHLNGIDLINGQYSTHLNLRPDKDTEEGYGVIYIDGIQDPIDLKAKGELGGIIDVRDQSVVKYLEKVDKLVKEVADKVNQAHLKGFGLDGSTGIPFFVQNDKKDSYDEITAGNIVINPELFDLNKMALSAVEGQNGNGDIASMIHQIREDLRIETETGEKKGIDDYYRHIVSSLALEREEAILNVQTQGFLINAIDGRRKEVSGVSIDEEMAEMVKYQYAYTANSRVANAIDEMIDIVVNRVGIIGR